MKEKINEYLKNLIETKPIYVLSDEEKKQIQFEGIEKYIINKLLSTKYRLKAVPDSLKDSVIKSVHYCVSNNLPIHLVFPFGAYKKWNLPTHPGIDWAEVFNMVLMREYLTPIAIAYKYGVVLEYYSVELFVSRNSKIPQESLDIYQKEFIQLLNIFNKFLPEKMEYKFTNLRTEISQEEAFKALDIKIKQLEKEWDLMDPKVKELKIKRAKVSYKQDSTEPNYEQNIKISVMTHDAFSAECWTKNGEVVWINAPDMVVVGNSYTGSWGVHIKSSKSSRVNFWVGIGAIINSKNSLLHTILSYDQYNKQIENIKAINVNYFHDDFMNLNTIPVISY